MMEDELSLPVQWQLQTTESHSHHYKMVVSEIYLINMYQVFLLPVSLEMSRNNDWTASKPRGLLQGQNKFEVRRQAEHRILCCCSHVTFIQQHLCLQGGQGWYLSPSRCNEMHCQSMTAPLLVSLTAWWLCSVLSTWAYKWWLRNMQLRHKKLRSYSYFQM